MSLFLRPRNTRDITRLVRTWTSFTASDTSLTVTSLNNTSFPYVWLRDSCQSTDCVHPSTSQKLHRTSDIPLDTRPASNGVSVSDDGIHVQWDNGHKSFYSRSFLERHSSEKKLATFHKDVSEATWDKEQVSKTPNLYVSYASLQSPSGLLAAITQITKYGLVFITGVPTNETSDEKCELRTLASYFSEIRETFYGRTWDVRNVRNSTNIAYTNLDLGFHMDLLYFQNPPRYQILHALCNRVRGGTSLFVDAKNVAMALQSKYPADFDVLSKTPVPFHYINDGHHLHYAHPTIQLATAPSTAVSHINYSPPFQAPLHINTPSNFYGALKRFSDLLNADEMVYSYTLKEGDAVIFDNRRVLHARTAFEDVAQGQEGDVNRWLKGCYLEEDAMWDRARVLRDGTDSTPKTN